MLAIGPGLGQSPETIKFAAGLLSSTELPAVLDADALNILAAKPVLLAKLARKGQRTLVLTPHPGEMARLAGTTIAKIQANRLEAARSFATRVGVTLVLKGARTLIAHPDGRVAVNTTGNPGMAKGGSGDLLTGMIAGLWRSIRTMRRERLRPRSICTALPQTWQSTCKMSTHYWPPMH